MSGFWKSTFKYGLPFLSFMVLGSFMLKEFTSIRYEVYGYKKRFGKSNIKDDYSYKFGVNPEEQTSNQDELEKLMELGAKDDWQNIRGPRPWEANTEFNELVEKVKGKAK